LQKNCLRRRQTCFNHFRLDWKYECRRPPFLTWLALEKLGMETMVTTTPWYSGKVRFDGISSANSWI
jgi:hypothetical protein